MSQILTERVSLVDGQDWINIRTMRGKRMYHKVCERGRKEREQDQKEMFDEDS